MILTHQHIDHLGLVSLVAQHSGAEVAAIDAAVPFVENYSEEAAAGRRVRARRDAPQRDPRGRGERAAARSRRRSAPGARRADVTRVLHDGERDRAARPHAARALPPRPQPHRHGLPRRASGKHAARRRPPARAHLVEPADHPAARRLDRAPAGARDLPRVARARPARWTSTSCSPATATRSPTTATLIDERFALHRRRAEKIHRLIAERPRTAYELAQALWGNIAVTQAYLTLSEVLGHTDLLINDGRVREVERDGVVASRRPRASRPR